MVELSACQRIAPKAVAPYAGMAFVLGLLPVILLAPSSAADAGAPVALDSAWQPAGDLSAPRFSHVSVVSNGRWFVAGGAADFSGVYLASVEVYDPAVGHWQLATPLMTGRTEMAAVADPVSGLVLFVGGKPSGQVLPIDASGEADLGDGTSWAKSQLLTPRFAHAAAFAAGKFVVSGGLMNNDDAEEMDSASSTWTPAGKMPSGTRGFHTMTTLADGHTILVAGGTGPNASGTGAIAATDIFDPAAGSWRKVHDMNTPRTGHCAVLLRDGRVMVTGGSSSPYDTASAEIYDPVSESWSLVPSMQFARASHAMVLLPDGRVLIAGGWNEAPEGTTYALNSVEIYDPVRNVWMPGAPLHEPRNSVQAAVLADGVYVAGGSSATGMPSPRAPNMMIVGTRQVLASTERLAFVSATPPDAGIVEGGADSGAVRAPGAVGGGGCACRAGSSRADTRIACAFACAFAVAATRSRRRSGRGDARKQRIGLVFGKNS